MNQFAELSANTRRGARGPAAAAQRGRRQHARGLLAKGDGCQVMALDLRPPEAVFDRGFTAKATLTTMAGLGSLVFIAGSSQNGGSRRTRKRLASHRVGCEGRIAHLKREYDGARSRLKGEEGARIWASWTGLAYNCDTVSRTPVKPLSPGLNYR